jgi:transcriptional regulator with XRE-family HTH domain
MTTARPALSAALRQARRQKDLTQEELARLLGVDPTLVSHWETGRKVPPLDRLLRMAEELGIDADRVIKLRAQHERARLELKKSSIPTGLKDLTSQVREPAAQYGDSKDPVLGDLERLVRQLRRLPRRVRAEIVRSFRRQIDAALREQGDEKPGR